MINIGGNIGELYVDSTPIEKAYIGSQLVWERDSPAPKYDAEVEYLQSSGTQYIETNIIPNANTGIYVKGQRVSGSDSFIVGLRNNTSNTRWAIGRASGWYFGYGTLLSNRYNVTIAECWMNYKNSKTIKCNDSVETSLPSLSFTPVYNIRLFGSAGVNAAYTKWYGRIYAVQITQGTEIIMDLVPVRKDTTGYMYDRVSKTLFGNSGTGSFTLGPDVT